MNRLFSIGMIILCAIFCTAIESNKTITAVVDNDTLLIDLYDSFNQYLYFNNNAASDDRISNISPSVVEEIVFNSRSFTEIRDKLADYISKYSGPMYNLNQNNINSLFKNYL